MNDDILVTPAMVGGWKKRREDLARKIIECKAEMEQIEQVLQMIPVLENMASSEPSLSAAEAVLSVMKKNRTHLFAAPEIMGGLKEMQYAPAEKWGAHYKYLYTVLGRLTKQGQIKKINTKYTLDGQEDINEGLSISSDPLEPQMLEIDVTRLRRRSTAE